MASLTPLRALTVAILISTGCFETEDFEPVDVRVASYNLAQVVGERAQPLADTLAELESDFVGLQECVDCDLFIDRVGSSYAPVGQPESGVSLLFDAERWELLEYDVIELGKNDDGWGRRVAIRAVFEEEVSRSKIAIYPTHWCVTVRRDDDRCDVERQLEYVDALLREVESCPLPSLVLGDLNVFEGFENGEVVERILERGLVDVFREKNPMLNHQTPSAATTSRQRDVSTTSFRRRR